MNIPPDVWAGRPGVALGHPTTQPSVAPARAFSKLARAARSAPLQTEAVRMVALQVHVLPARMIVIHDEAHRPGIHRQNIVGVQCDRLTPHVPGAALKRRRLSNAAALHGGEMTSHRGVGDAEQPGTNGCHAVQRPHAISGPDPDREPEHLMSQARRRPPHGRHHEGYVDGHHAARRGFGGHHHVAPHPDLPRRPVPRRHPRRLPHGRQGMVTAKDTVTRAPARVGTCSTGTQRRLTA